MTPAMAAGVTNECGRPAIYFTHWPWMAVFDFIEGSYNTDRRHSALDYDSPIRLRREARMHPPGSLGRSEPIDVAVVRLLRSVASGAITGDQAMADLMARETELVGNRRFEAAWSLIQHFTDDSDIRAKDPNYDRKQREDMERLADEIAGPRPK